MCIRDRLKSAADKVRNTYLEDPDNLASVAYDLDGKNMKVCIFNLSDGDYKIEYTNRQFLEGKGMEENLIKAIKKLDTQRVLSSIKQSGEYYVCLLYTSRCV